jgi:hypothetical protein
MYQELYLKFSVHTKDDMALRNIKKSIRNYYIMIFDQISSALETERYIQEVV